jgi:hypothetical protein
MLRQKHINFSKYSTDKKKRKMRLVLAGQQYFITASLGKIDTPLYELYLGMLKIC